MTQPQWPRLSSADDVADYRAETPIDLDRAPRLAPVPAVVAPPMVDATGQVAASWTYEPSQQQRPRRAARAELGWQSRVGKLTAGLIKPDPGAAELAHRAALQMMRATLPAARLVMVANEKGGAGKTPASVILAGLIARARAEPVVAWDVNEMRGSLGLRSEIQQPPATVVDVLRESVRLGRADSRTADLGAFLRRQPQGHLVLASTTDGNAMREISLEDCHIVLQLLQRRFGIVIADTGNNAASQPFRYSLDAADVLVIPAKPVASHLEPARKLLAATVARDLTRHLAQRAVLVITSTTGARLDPDEERWFTDKGIRVLHVPGDAVIEADGPIALDDLSTASLRAWTLVAGAVMEAAAQPSPTEPRHA